MNIEFALKSCSYSSYQSSWHCRNNDWLHSLHWLLWSQTLSVDKKYIQSFVVGISFFLSYEIFYGAAFDNERKYFGEVLAEISVKILNSICVQRIFSVEAHLKLINALTIFVIHFLPLSTLIIWNKSSKNPIFAQ